MKTPSPCVPTKALHILNLGAGVQSTTLYLMFMRGEITPQIDCAIFADTQDEPQAVYEHLHWLRSLNGPRILTGTAGRLSADLLAGRNSTGGRFASIPAFNVDEDGKIGIGRRQCSKEYKTEVIGRVIRGEVLGLKERQRCPKSVLVHQYFGISFDEGGRARRISDLFRRSHKWAIPRFPLLDRFMTRADCLTWLTQRYPGRNWPRSACVFCPYHSDAEWSRVAAVPEDWDKALMVDAALRADNERGIRPVYLHRSCKPLDLVQLDTRPTARDLQMPMSFYQECEGVCGV